MTENELVREWTAEEAATKSVRAAGDGVTPKVSRKAAAASGADHLPGIAPTTEDRNPGQPPDPPRTPAGNPEVKP